MNIGRARPMAAPFDPPMSTSGVSRVIALGASNLSLGLESLVCTARGAWGPDVEIFAAPGYGRSYGAPSRVALRTLPGVLQCGLWSALEKRPEAQTRGLVMDVGNDILYGVSPEQLLEWVDEAITKLLARTADVVLATLPVESVARLAPGGYLLFRTVFFPSSRLSREEAVAGVQQVNEGLIQLAARRVIRLVEMKPHWYGFDPIHIRPRFWPAAWKDILIGPETRGSEGLSHSGMSHGPSRGAAAFSLREWARLHTLPPERRWLAGWERVHEQSGRSLSAGGRLWLY